jgi:hypothetical protein
MAYYLVTVTGSTYYLLIITDSAYYHVTITGSACYHLTITVSAYYLVIVCEYASEHCYHYSIALLGNLHNSTAVLLNVTVTIGALVAPQILVLVMITVKSKLKNDDCWFKKFLHFFQKKKQFC